MSFTPSSSSKTTVTRTTHTTTGTPAGSMLGGTTLLGSTPTLLSGTPTLLSGTPTLLSGTPTLLGGTTSLLGGRTVIPGGSTSSTTTTTYTTTRAGGVPMVTTSNVAMPMLPGTGLTQTYMTGGTPSMWAVTERSVIPGVGTTVLKPYNLGQLSVTPFRPTVTTARMGLAPMDPNQTAQVQAANKVTYSNSASLVLNGIECAGYIAIANNKIVEAKNIFIGVAPFQLSPETLEVTEDMTVVARNPDIRYHIGELPNEQQHELTLADIAKLAEIPESSPIYIGLPGQSAGQAVEENGVFVIYQPTPVLNTPMLTTGMLGAPMIM